jgi:hypothetical protein
MKVVSQSGPRVGISRSRRRGVALVVTLIMLAIITFMAISFLVLSQGQKASSAQSTDQVTARLAADTARERAIAEMQAFMSASGNPFNFELLVSTNYISPAGFIASGPGYASPTNVSYTYPNSLPLTGNDRLQNIANLQYSPRPPVYMTTNRALGLSDFRYYLDLNRNGAFEPTGWLATSNGPVYLTGDPQWIGGLQSADRPHSANNPFLFRYIYLVLPISKTLDINYIHNCSKFLDMANPAIGDGFLRNQGVGPWEINLAPFLVDLNTNLWPLQVSTPYGAPYVYNVGLSLANKGSAADDAVSLLRYRYYPSWSMLRSISTLFAGAPGQAAFANNGIDDYAGGPIMTGTSLPADPDVPRLASGWPGADNTNHFFTPQEFFDRSKTAINVNPLSLSFSDRLLIAGTNNSPYDRYTYYRFLAAMGTDSAADTAGKMNLNFDNLVRTNALGIASATNFINWEPLAFFTNAADRLLRAQGYPFGINAIPVYTNGTFVYPASVHRLLQLAANIYDATTNRTYLGSMNYPYLPTVFQPLFQSRNGGVYITNWVEVTDTNLFVPFGRGTLRDLTDTNVANQVQPYDLVMGVPLVIGAKKGLPSFSKVIIDTIVEMTRKVQLTRPTSQAERSQWSTNVMYVLSISNALGNEAWNSYRANFVRPVDIFVTNFMTVGLTNNVGFSLPIPQIPLGGVFSIPNLTNSVYRTSWPGLGLGAQPNLASLVIPLQTNVPTLPPSIYRFAPPRLEPNSTNNGAIFDRIAGFIQPHWGLAVTNRLVFMITDHATGRIIDYVHLNSLISVRDLSAELADPNNAMDFAGLWSTNTIDGTVNGTPQGIINQITVCLNPANDTVNWASYGTMKSDELESFRQFFNKDARNTALAAQVPFTPTRRLFQSVSWQVNDPLVHYTADDLAFTLGRETTHSDGSTPFATLKHLGQVNDRYSPWGGNNMKTGGDTSAGPDPDAFNLAVKDPLVTCSDDWDFPAGKFANIGWMGRVHRGTPWQTVFLKSTNVLQRADNQVAGLKDWRDYSGHQLLSEALLTAPTNDWRLLDVFTTALNDNSARGQMSVNQTNLAAWSAILGEVNVLPDLTTNVFIQPAGIYDPAAPPPLVRIVNGIIKARATFPGGSFQRLGDILATPELTIASPYLSGRTNLMNDAVYERIPQQMLGLLKGGEQPRFVIYSFGQTLKPAANSKYMASPYFGMCTNYQITAECATKAVVRIEGPLSRPRVVIESYNVLPPD